MTKRKDDKHTDKHTDMGGGEDRERDSYMAAKWAGHGGQPINPGPEPLGV